jgi:hypothetical protein
MWQEETSMNTHGDLPASSPFRRNSITISCHSNTSHPEPLYVVPLDEQIILASSEEALAVLGNGDVPQLIQVLQTALDSRSANDTEATAINHRSKQPRERWEPVLLEERTLLTELEQLSRQAPDLILDFQSGALSIDQQITYALRLMHVAETMMIHGKARERVAGDHGNR